MFQGDFGRHPWSIGGGGALGLKEASKKRRRGLVRMSDLLHRAGRAHRRRAGVHVRPHCGSVAAPSHPMSSGGYLSARMCGIGLEWRHRSGIPIAVAAEPLQRELWALRTTLAARRTFRSWRTRVAVVRHMQHTVSAYATPLSITFAFVATHNHFVLDRGGKVFNRSAPVIKLPAGATRTTTWPCSASSTAPPPASGSSRCFTTRAARWIPKVRGRRPTPSRTSTSSQAPACSNSPSSSPTPPTSPANSIP
jgi:hypothetical protein